MSHEGQKQFINSEQIDHTFTCDGLFLWHGEQIKCSTLLSWGGCLAILIYASLFMKCRFNKTHCLKLLWLVVNETVCLLHLNALFLHPEVCRIYWEEGSI